MIIRMATEAPHRETMLHDENSATVSVYNINGFDELKLELLFESETRSNGGNVKNIAIHKELNLAYVTFEDPKVAGRVLAKGEITFNGVTLKIQHGPQIDPFSILVYGLEPRITKEMLELYFESTKHSGGGTVEDMEYDGGRSWARVTFKSKEVAERVLNHQHKLYDVPLTVVRHVLPQAIEVYPINGLDLESLELYFDSKKHSNGGYVTSCHAERGVAIIHFEDFATVRRVLQQKHIVQGHEVQVKVYYPEVGITRGISSLSDTPPRPFTIDLPHRIVQQFWDQSPDVSTWLTEVGDHFKFHIDAADGVLTVTYKASGLDTRTPETWKQEGSEEIKAFLEKVSFISLPISKNCIKSLDDKCAELSNEKAFAVCDHDTNMVLITGFEEAVKKLEFSVKQFISGLSVIESTVPLARWQLHLMNITNHIDYMRQRIPGLDITAVDLGLVLRGLPEQIQIAFSLLFDDFANSCVQHDFQMHDSVFGALRSKPLFDRVQEMLKMNNILAVIEPDEDSNLVVIHALSDADAERCAGLITQSFVHKRVKVPAQHQQLLQSDGWQELCCGLLEDHQNLPVISCDVSSGTLDITCWQDEKDIADKVLDRLKNIFTEECLLPLPAPVVYLFVVHYADRLKMITDNLNQLFSDAIPMTISLCDPSEISGFMIHGSAESIGFVKEELWKLSAEVVPVDVSLTTHSTFKYLLSPSGQAFLEDISQVYRVVNVIDDNTDALVKRLKEHLSGSSADQNTVTVAPSHIISLSSGLKIEIHCREIESASLDMIIVPADEHLNHTLSGVKHLINYAGSSVTAACQEHVQDKEQHSVAIGSLCETEAGHLQCRKLLHVVCSRGNLMSSADGFIQDVIVACMEHIKNAHVNSIAFKVFEVASGERIPLTVKARVFAAALVTAFLDKDLTVKHMELVCSEPLLSQILNDVLLRVFTNFGIKADAVTNNVGTDAAGEEAGMAASGSNAGGTDLHNIRFYGLTASNVESAAKEVKSRCDEHYDTLLRSLSEWPNGGEANSNEEQTEGRDPGATGGGVEDSELGATGGGVEDSELGATGGGKTSAPQEQYYWEYISEDGESEPFSPEVSDILETKYTEDTSATIEYVDEAGRRQIVDFPTMRKYMGFNPKKFVTVRRVPGKLPLFLTTAPSKWDEMKPGERLKVVELDKDSCEYKSVEQAFLKSAKKSRIVVQKIERIQNPVLYQQYKVKKQLMDRVNDVSVINQRRLYHGTAYDVIDNINTNGFNRSYCGKRATVYGRGVYFAKEASFSVSSVYTPYDRNRCRYCYQCLVLTGEYTRGCDYYIEPPPKDQDNPAVRYDSVVDSENDPEIFVIFNDTQAYPEYLITFND